MFVEPRQATGKRADSVFIGCAHHHAHRQVLERHAGFGDERLAGGLERLGDADGIHDDIVGLGADGGGRDFFQVVPIQRARATAFHLLEIVAAFHIAHEQQALQRLDVGAGGDHVHGDGNARVILIAELLQHGLGVFLGFVGEFFAEGVALVKFLAHGLDDVVSVAVGFGEDQGFGHFGASGKNLRQFVAEGADDGAYLVKVYDVAVQLRGGIGFVFVLLFPALPAREFFAFLHLLPGGDLRALPGDLCFDHVDFIADIDAIGHGFFVAVIADYVFLEKTVSSIVRRGG